MFKSFSVYSTLMRRAEQIKQQMEKLPDYVGKKVCVTYVRGGKEDKEEGELGEVRQFSNLKFSDGPSIPFLGTGIAIKEVLEIKNGEVEVIYRNPFVNKSYNEAKCEDVRKESGFPKPKLKLL